MTENAMQTSPFPTILADLVDKVKYKEGFTFNLSNLDRGQGSKGLTLVINYTGPDSYKPDQQISVNHYMIVPPAAYDKHSWTRWLLEQVLLVEQHEACEFFIIDGERPYAPHHGPGNNPYTIFDIGTVEDARTTFRGERL